MADKSSLYGFSNMKFYERETIEMDAKNRCILIPREVGLSSLREALIEHFPNIIFASVDDWEVQRFGFQDIPDVVLVDYETLKTLLFTVPNPLPKSIFIVIRFESTATLPTNSLNIIYIDPFPCSMQGFISNIYESLTTALGC